MGDPGKDLAELDRMFGVNVRKNVMPVAVCICRVNPMAKLPAYATEGSVAVDIQTMVDVELFPGCCVRAPTGLAIALPDGYEAVVRPRSSRSGENLLVHFGTVDSDYRGEMLLNLTYVGNDVFRCKAGERLAQLLVKPVPRIKWNEVATIEELGATKRGASGFGSSGV